MKRLFVIGLLLLIQPVEARKLHSHTQPIQKIVLAPPPPAIKLENPRLLDGVTIRSEVTCRDYFCSGLAASMLKNKGTLTKEDVEDCYKMADLMLQVRQETEKK